MLDSNCRVPVCSELTLSIKMEFSIQINSSAMGAQWLSGRVLDSRPRGRGFKPQWRHYVVVLEQDTFILA